MFEYLCRGTMPSCPYLYSDSLILVEVGLRSAPTIPAPTTTLPCPHHLSSVFHLLSPVHSHPHANDPSISSGKDSMLHEPKLGKSARYKYHLLSMVTMHSTDKTYLFQPVPRPLSSVLFLPTQPVSTGFPPLALEFIPRR